MNLTQKINLIKFVTQIHTIINNLTLTTIITILIQLSVKILENSYNFLPLYIITFLIYNRKKIKLNPTYLSYIKYIIYIHKWVTNTNISIHILYEIYQNIQNNLDILYKYIVIILYHQKNFLIFIINQILLKDITLNPFKRFKQLLTIFLKKPLWRQILDITLIIIINTLPIPLNKIVSTHIIQAP